jgi:hypothetical protein
VIPGAGCQTTGDTNLDLVLMRVVAVIPQLMLYSSLDYLNLPIAVEFLQLRHS